MGGGLVEVDGNEEEPGHHQYVVHHPVVNGHHHQATPTPTTHCRTHGSAVKPRSPTSLNFPIQKRVHWSVAWVAVTVLIGITVCITCGLGENDLKVEGALRQLPGKLPALERKWSIIRDQLRQQYPALNHFHQTIMRGLGQKCHLHQHQPQTQSWTPRPPKPLPASAEKVRAGLGPEASSPSPSEPLQLGAPITAQWMKGHRRYPGVVAQINTDGTYDIRYDDGDFERRVERRFIVPRADQHPEHRHRHRHQREQSQQQPPSPQPQPQPQQGRRNRGIDTVFTEIIARRLPRLLLNQHPQQAWFDDLALTIFGGGLGTPHATVPATAAPPRQSAHPVASRVPQKINLDELVHEVVAEHPPEARGKREEWERRVGVGRRECTRQKGGCQEKTSREPRPMAGRGDKSSGHTERQRQQQQQQEVRYGEEKRPRARKAQRRRHKSRKSQRRREEHKRQRRHQQEQPRQRQWGGDRKDQNAYDRQHQHNTQHWFCPLQ